MGILNITEDSFYAGSRIKSIKDLLMVAENMIRHDVDILDVGAYSTRPGAVVIQESVEIRNLVSAINALRKEFPQAVISADTFRATCAVGALDAGADMINDVSGGDVDGDLFAVVLNRQVPYVLMHMRGNPQTMNSLAVYSDLVGEIAKELSVKINYLRSNGLNDLILDPGFGFAKTADQNFELLKRFGELQMFDLPLMVGISRKSMVWRTLKCSAEGALNGSTALHMLALERGANILRVHDVKEAVEAIKLWEKFSAA